MLAPAVFRCWVGNEDFGQNSKVNVMIILIVYGVFVLIMLGGVVLFLSSFSKLIKEAEADKDKLKNWTDELRVVQDEIDAIKVAREAGKTARDVEVHLVAGDVEAMEMAAMPLDRQERSGIENIAGPAVSKVVQPVVEVGAD